MHSLNNNRYFYPIVILAITTLGLLLRLKFLGNMGSYWFDEMASLVTARLNYPKILEYFILENNPPLSFIYLHYWIKLFGEGESITRLSSVVFGTLSIPMTYLVGKEILSRKAGLIASLFMTLSFYQIYHSVELRMYSMFLFFSLVSIYFYLKAITISNSNNKFWLFYTLFSTLLIYTHIFGWLIILFQNLFFILFIKQFKQFKTKLFTINIALVIIFFPWFIPKIASLSQQPIINGWYFSNFIPPASFFEIFQDLTINTNNNVIFDFLIQITLIILTISFFIPIINQIKTNKFNDNKKVFIILWIIIPLLTVPLIGFKNINLAYYISIGPALYLIIAEGTVNIINVFKKDLLITAIISLLLFSSSLQNIIDNYKIYYWDEVASYVNKKTEFGDKIIISGFMDIIEFKQYYLGKTPYEGFSLIDNKNGGEIEKMILKYNWNSSLHNNIDNQKFNSKMENITKNNKRIILIDSIPDFYDPENKIINWFPQNNWRLLEIKNFRYKYATPIKPRMLIWEKIK